MFINDFSHSSVRIMNIRQSAVYNTLQKTSKVLLFLHRCITYVHIGGKSHVSPSLSLSHMTVVYTVSLAP